MKNSKIYAFLTFLFLGSTSVSAQSILDLYFCGNKDSLPVLFFNLPEAVPLRKYSYRASISMAPDDYILGLKAVNAPMLVLIGSNDEAFSAEVLQKAVLKNSSGKVHIIDKATHNGVRHNTQSFNFIKYWFSKL